MIQSAPCDPSNQFDAVLIDFCAWIEAVFMGDEECSFQLFIKKLDIEDSVIFYREPKHTDEVHYKSILNHEDNWYLDVGIS